MFLTRYNSNRLHDPLTLFDGIRRDFERRIFDGALPVTSAGGAPRVTVSEDDSAYTLRLEVPGLTSEALDVRVEDGVLHLAGERNDATPEGYEARRSERVRYRFDRKVRLPEGVDAPGIVANLKDGLLTVTVPKLAKPEARKITVTAS